MRYKIGRKGTPLFCFVFYPVSSSLNHSRVFTRISLVPDSLVQPWLCPRPHPRTLLCLFSQLLLQGRNKTTLHTLSPSLSSVVQFCPLVPNSKVLHPTSVPTALPSSLFLSATSGTYLSRFCDSDLPTSHQALAQKESLCSLPPFNAHCLTA